MSLNLTFKIEQTVIANVPGDVSITITGYLQDLANVPFINSATGAVDTFLVQTSRSSLPSGNYDTYLAQLAQKVVASKYTNSLTGNTLVGSDTIEDMSSTAGLFPQMTVTGSNIQAGTFLVGVRDLTSIRVSQVATATGTGITFSFTPANWAIDYTALTVLTTIINFGSL